MAYSNLGESRVARSAWTAAVPADGVSPAPPAATTASAVRSDRTPRAAEPALANPRPGELRGFATVRAHGQDSYTVHLKNIGPALHADRRGAGLSVEHFGGEALYLDLELLNAR